MAIQKNTIQKFWYERDFYLIESSNIISPLKGARNILFLRPPRPTDQTVIFQNKFTLWYVRLNIFIRKTKFSSHKQYLFGPLFSKNTKKNHTDQSIVQTFLPCLRRNISQTYKSSSCKKSLSNVCISLIQLASMNVFYSMW